MRLNPDVYLVGAGPGDPDLLTVKAHRVLSEADIVVYDRLVSSEILELCQNHAKRIYVGKSVGNHHMSQDDINLLLVRLAKKRRILVRLKGGDPFIFGRGGEEAEYVIRNGLSCEVIPGITSAAGCSTYAGIPLTYRGLASGVHLIAGHCQENEPLDLNWKNLADSDTTLVIYMGLGHLPIIAGNLIRAGMSPETPVAVIENGTTPRQRHCIAKLFNISDCVVRENIHPPSLIVIGRVVKLADTLDLNTNISHQIDHWARSNVINFDN